MAHNPQGPEGNGNHDPAGSTQMFRAFVDEGEPQRRQPAAAPSGPKTGVIVTVVAVLVVLAAVAWLALG